MLKPTLGVRALEPAVETWPMHVLLTKLGRGIWESG